CVQLVDYGKCNGHVMMWAYSMYDHKCFRFAYSTCGGNTNRFRTLEECQRTCGFTINV
ncbi:hypothetical protein KR054_000677, partial [Drosophila jambulina]